MAFLALRTCFSCFFSHRAARSFLLSSSLIDNRDAAYFGKKAFEDIVTLPDAVADDSGHALVERFKQEGIPALYRQPEAETG
jgi:hypothetical protein